MYWQYSKFWDQDLLQSEPQIYDNKTVKYKIHNLGKWQWFPSNVDIVFQNWMWKLQCLKSKKHYIIIKMKIENSWHSYFQEVQLFQLVWTYGVIFAHTCTKYISLVTTFPRQLFPSNYWFRFNYFFVQYVQHLCFKNFSFNSRTQTLKLENVCQEIPYMYTPKKGFECFSFNLLKITCSCLNLDKIWCLPFSKL